MDATAWATIALLLFLAVVWRMGAFKGVAASLDKRAEGIARELSEARRLRSEAEVLLRQYQSRREQAESEARAIVAEAKLEAAQLRQDLRRQLDQDLARREAQTEERIARAETQAGAEVRSVAAKAAIETAERLLVARVTPSVQAQLVDAGAQELGRKLAS